MSHQWYIAQQKATGIAPIKDFLIHLIDIGTEAYGGTSHAKTFPIWHDRLNQLWEKDNGMAKQAEVFNQ